MGDNNHFEKLLGSIVKVLYVDDGKTKAVIGVLNEVNLDNNYIVVKDVAVGLGSNFISCIPREEKNGD